MGLIDKLLDYIYSQCYRLAESSLINYKCQMPNKICIPTGASISARQQYRHKPFSDFEEKVRECRRRHQLGGNVRLQSDSGQQSQLEN